MKKLNLILIVLLLAYIKGYTQVSNNDTYTFTSETTPSGEVHISHNLKASLSERGKNARGTVFNVIYDNADTWELKQKTALEYAVKLWEEQLLTCYPRINLRVKLQNIGTSLTRTQTRYYIGRNFYEGDNYIMTGVLLKNWQIDAPDYLQNMGTDSLQHLFENDDIVITFNNEKDIFYWGIDGNTPADKYDFVTVALREIAKGIGIVSTVSQRGNNIFTAYLEGKATIFDSLIGLNPTRYPSRSPELSNFVQSGKNRQIEIKITSQEKEIMEFYVPNTFDPAASLNYLSEESAIACDAEFLKAKLPKGSSFHRISKYVNKLLYDHLGWKKTVPVGTTSSPGQSANTDIIDYTTGTSFSSLPNNGTQSIIQRQNDSNIQPLEWGTGELYPYYPQGNNYEGDRDDAWHLEILRNDGKYITVKSQTNFNPNFTIKPSDVPDNENWARNPDGYLRARIYFRNYDIPQGYPPYVYTYILLDYLPQKPELAAVTKNSTTTRKYDPFPELMLHFKAWGATSVKLEHESEDGIVNYYFDPNVEEIDMSNADPYIENTFTLTAINKNGEKISNIVKWGGEDFMTTYNSFSRKLKSIQTNNNLILKLESYNGHGTVINDPEIKGEIRNYNITKVDNPSLYINGNTEGSQITIPTKNLYPGIYAIRVIDEKGDSYSMKFVK